MSAPLVFMDTETTGLSLDDDIWEFAAIRRETDGTETEHHIFIEHDRKKCKALPESFREDHYDRYLDHRAVSKLRAANLIIDVFGDPDAKPRPHVIGAVPNFDTERIAALCASEGYRPPAWHYHLVDVESLAIGRLAGKGVGRQLYAPPWNSNEISRAVGVEPDSFERHTAMGDVRWAMAIYDAVMGGTA